uniref:Uncharacterized protein n=1 Tax=Triticum aestivum TaxID=4565 RepID=A0A3B6B050_WHEAT
MRCTGQRVRLYVHGTILGYKRPKSNQYEMTSLVQIEGVNTKEDVAWYGGKRMAYVYKAKTKSNNIHLALTRWFTCIDITILMQHRPDISKGVLLRYHVPIKANPLLMPSSI